METVIETAEPTAEELSAGKAYLSQPNRLLNLKGKAYLQVADRVYAFRLDHPTWSIITAPVEGNLAAGYVVFQARVMDGDSIIATGHKCEAKGSFADWFEKAETGAIGRALGYCGYGTLAALDEDPSHPCDAPRERPNGNGHSAPARDHQPQGGPAKVDTDRFCSTCGCEVLSAVVVLSQRKYGRTYCPDHQPKAANQ
jgi:hypothetical protein